MRFLAIKYALLYVVQVCRFVYLQTSAGKQTSPKYK